MFSEPFEDGLEGFEGCLLGLPGVSQGARAKPPRLHRRHQRRHVKEIHHP